jgi:uncharacterized peroxidase-related enzyme
MPHISIPDNLPGMRGLMAFRPETAQPLNEIAEILLRKESTISRGNRELIATFVSHLNDCFFCQNAHGGIAQHYLQCDLNFIDSIKTDYLSMPISEKMKIFLRIAASVQKSGKSVSEAQILAAKELGATDLEIHDVVMIAAFFCFCNRYVDGLATDAPQNRQFYIDRGAMRAAEGYAHFDPKN